MQPTHRTVIALLAVCTGGVALVAQQPPVFRAEIDSVQLDVRVVDEDGRFVRDLDRGDLQVFEDGQPQTISTFAMVDIPIAGEAGRPSMIPSDVACRVVLAGTTYRTPGDQMLAVAAGANRDQWAGAVEVLGRA